MLEARTITVFWQTRHIFHAFNLPAEDFFDRFNQTICKPLAKLMERDKVVPRNVLRGVGFDWVNQ